MYCIIKCIVQGKRKSASPVLNVLRLDTVSVSNHFCDVYWASFFFFWLFFLAFMFFDILRDFVSCIACLLYVTPTFAQRIVVTSEQCDS